MRVFATLFCVLWCSYFGGCGTVGEPLYPALNIPTRVSDLAAFERGDRIDITFTIPPQTTEGLALKEIGSVDLRVGPNAAPAFDVNQWANGAEKVKVATPEKPGPVPMIEVPARSFIGKNVVVGVRVANAKGKNSEWSNLVSVAIEQPLVKPTDFKAEPVAQGVALTWDAPQALQFRIFRRSAQEATPALLAIAREPKYLDSTAEFGKTYEYYVQSMHDKSESDVAGPETITPKDVFPPQVPTGLTASPGLASIELAWDRNTESDFKEYKVFRAEANGPFVQIADGLEAPSYSDHNVESGKRYRYRVTAMDQSGNMSETCAPVEAIGP
jgi:hypothetical protein